MGRRHPAVEADIARGSYALAVVCVAGLILAGCTFLFCLAANWNADRQFPLPQPTTSTATERSAA